MTTVDPDTPVRPADAGRGEVEVRGHKVFISGSGQNIFLEAVNDDRPLVRMTFRLGIDAAEDIAQQLREAIDRGEANG